MNSWLSEFLLSFPNRISISHFPFKPKFTCKEPESVTFASEHDDFITA